MQTSSITTTMYIQTNNTTTTMYIQTNYTTTTMYMDIHNNCFQIDDKLAGLIRVTFIKMSNIIKILIIYHPLISVEMIIKYKKYYESDRGVM